MAASGQATGPLGPVAHAAQRPTSVPSIIVLRSPGTAFRLVMHPPKVTSIFRTHTKHSGQLSSKPPEKPNICAFREVLRVSIACECAVDPCAALLLVWRRCAPLHLETRRRSLAPRAFSPHVCVPPAALPSPSSRTCPATRTSILRPLLTVSNSWTSSARERRTDAIEA